MSLPLPTLEQRAQQYANVPKRELSANEKLAIEKVVEDNLRDPLSAMFKWEKYVEKENIYCGHVNSKNGFGGYTGYVPFEVFVTFSNGRVLPGFIAVGNTIPNDVANSVIQGLCADHGYLVY